MSYSLQFEWNVLKNSPIVAFPRLVAHFPVQACAVRLMSRALAGVKYVQGTTYSLGRHMHQAFLRLKPETPL